MRLNLRFNLKEKIENIKRILLVARKPTKEEFLKTTKICVIGILLIGFIGFIFYIIFTILLG